MSKHRENNNGEQSQDLNESHSQQGQSGQKGQKANQSQSNGKNGGNQEQNQAQQESKKAVEEQNKRAAQAAPQFSQEQIEQAESQEGDDKEMKGLTSHGVDASSAHDLQKQRMEKVQSQMSQGARSQSQSQQGFENIDQQKLRQASEKLNSDEEFKKAFESDPKSALEKEGIKLPEGVEAFEASKYEQEKQNRMHAKQGNEPQKQPKEFRSGKIVLVKE